MSDPYKWLVDVLWEPVEEVDPGFTKDVMLERIRLIHPTEQDAAVFLFQIESARLPPEEETPVQVIAREVKIEHVTSIAYRLARQGGRPDLAWVEGIREVYPSDKVESQLQHTCPKWAFSILCHRGLVDHVAGGCCPAAEGKRSADFVLTARELLLSEPSLAGRKQDLKRRVFGLPSAPGFRKPNQEIEVLLALMQAGAVQI
jgi:hypothetical protein